jgi:hypothetical protein
MYTPGEFNAIRFLFLAELVVLIAAYAGISNEAIFVIGVVLFIGYPIAKVCGDALVSTSYFFALLGFTWSTLLVFVFRPFLTLNNEPIACVYRPYLSQTDAPSLAPTMLRNSSSNT